MLTTTMRLSAFATVAIGALALAGCGSSDTIEAENESVESVAEKVAKADIRPSPGKWVSKMTIEKIEIPGLPPEMQGMMKAQMGKIEESSSCLTPEEAEKPDADFFQPGADSGCKYNSFKMGGGEIEADMTCEKGGMAQNMKMSGTYSEESYAMKVSAEGNMQGQPMSMAMAIESQRVGECDAQDGG